MIRKSISLAALIVVLALNALGAGFEFITVTNIPSLHQSGLNLNAVANNGDSFVSVGTNSAFWVVNTNQFANFLSAENAKGYLLSTSAWTNGQVSTVNATNYNLKAITYGENCFVASGSTNIIFTNSFASGAKWGYAGKALPSGDDVDAQGMAYNSNVFVLVSAFYQAAWTNNVAGTNQWIVGANQNTAIVESFRSVTAFGSNNFALCGIRGDIRISTNNGAFWNASQIFSFSSPDLLSIASDNTNALVAVGTDGTIKVSLNGGNKWTTQTILANSAKSLTNYFSTTNFNSVAYLSGTNFNEFVVSGSGGTILLATNNIGTASWIWTLQTNNIGGVNIAGDNIRAASFANSGFFQGVIMMVGDNGTLVIGGTPPLPPTSLGNQTNCSPTESSPNPPLVMQVEADPDHPTNSITVDWFDSNMKPVTNSVNNTLTGSYATGLFTNLTMDASLNPNQPTTYEYFAQTRDLRTGLTSSLTNIFLTINPRPTSVSLTTNTICNAEGEEVVLANVLTGFSPWTVYWTDGFATFTQSVTNLAAPTGPYTNTLIIPNVAFNPMNIFANQSTNHYYWVTMLEDGNGCISALSDTTAKNLSGTNLITVNPRPTASLLTTNTICNSGSTVLQANLTGLGPWTVYWTDGTTTFTQSVNVNVAGPYADYLTIPNGAFNPTNLLPNQSVTNQYWVIGVSNADSCLGNQLGDLACTNIVIINPRPTASLLTTNTICNGGSAVLQANLTGLGPWTVFWTDGSTTFTQFVNVNLTGPYVDLLSIPNGAFNPTNTFLNQSAIKQYWVIGVSNSDSCMGNQPGDLACTNTIVINPRPTSTLFSLNATNCNDGTSYMLTNVLTGIGPWTNVWSLDGQAFVQVVGANGASGPFTNSLRVFPTNSNGASAPSNNVYYVMAVVNGDTCSGNQPGDITGTNMVSVNPAPPAPVVPQLYVTNVLGNFGSLTVSVATNCTAWWYDSTTNLVLTNNSLIYFPTNVVCGLYTNYVEAHNTNTGCLGVDFSEIVYVLVPPAPTSGGDQTNCAGVFNPLLSATVLVNSANPPGKLTANWYNAQVSGTEVATDSLFFEPTNAEPGVYTYWVGAQDVATGLASTNLTPVVLNLEACTNPPVISFHGPNGTVQWYGDLTLQTTTNLTPPVTWIDLTNPSPVVGTNKWDLTNGITPLQFFRLWPTN